MKKKIFPLDLLQLSQKIDSTFYRIGKGDLEGSLAGEMISLWRKASSSFFEELFGSVFSPELSTVYADKAPFLIGKYSTALSYNLAAEIEAEAEKVILASFRKGFAKAERDVGASTVFSAPIHKVFPFAGFAKAAIGSFFGMRVVPTINYILKEFSLFQSGDDLDALCTVLQKDCVDPILHWRKEASIHVSRAYHYGYASGASSLEIPLLSLILDKNCCPVCAKMANMNTSPELVLTQYRKVSQSAYEDLRQTAPFPTEESIALWEDNLAYASFALLPFHPFCACQYAIRL